MSFREGQGHLFWVCKMPNVLGLFEWLGGTFSVPATRFKDIHSKPPMLAFICLWLILWLMSFNDDILNIFLNPCEHSENKFSVKKVHNIKEMTFFDNIYKKLVINKMVLNISHECLVTPTDGLVLNAFTIKVLNMYWLNTLETLVSAMFIWLGNWQGNRLLYGFISLD